MNLSCPCTSESYNKVLEGLLDAFGSVFSHEKITSVYCKSEHDVNRAGEILCHLQGSTSGGTFDACSGEMGFAKSDKLFHEDTADSSTHLCKNQKRSKLKKPSASMGTISGILGKSYARPCFSVKEPSEITIPLTFEMKEQAVDELMLGPVISDSTCRNRGISNKEVEEFLFSMLGDGFQLSTDAIRGVLGQCGYDMEKSFEKLLTSAEKTLGKGMGTQGATESKDRCPKMEPCLSDGIHAEFTYSKRSLKEPSGLNKEGYNIQREVLEALFTAPKRFEVESERTFHPLGLNRTRVLSQKPICRPQDGIASRTSTETTNLKDDIVHVGIEEDTFMVFRGAMKQNWEAMKAYYEAAVEAFIKGDQTKANYLLEQGKYYNKMARDADEKSAGEIFGSRSTESQKETISLDLHIYRSKEALDLLRFHLHKLASIPSIHYLKVIVNTDAKDITKGKRKKLVVDLLEKESIQWVEEEGNPGTIRISLDMIDPKRLSFVNDSQNYNEKDGLGVLVVRATFDGRVIADRNLLQVHRAPTDLNCVILNISMAGISLFRVDDLSRCLQQNFLR